MKLRQYKRYNIYNFECFSFYCINKNGLINIYQHNDRDADYYHDIIWIDGSFTDIKLLWKNDVYSNKRFCYLLLKEYNGKGKIIELLENKIILEKFQFNSFKVVKKRTINNENGVDKEDAVISFLNKKTKFFALYSITEKFIFGPYNYKVMEQYAYGYKLDDKFIIENNGEIIDISGYEFNGTVWHNKDNDDYFMDLDIDGSVVKWLENDEYDKDLLFADVENTRYIYNKSTEELHHERLYNDDPVDWSMYNDIAYEGHSRLELGLE